VPIKEDWQKDPTLTMVVNTAVAGTSDYLAQTYPNQVGSGQLELFKVSDFESQVCFLST
jgi:hypothetical protein